MLLLSLVPLREVGAATPGIVMDNQTGRAVFFDSDLDVITGSVPLGSSLNGTGDCLVLGDRGPAFSTDFGFRVWALELQPVPRLGPSPNPIRISNPGEDLAASSDGRFLVVCDGNGPAPVSVVEVASGREVATFSLGTDCDAVDVCDDGSVLVASFGEGVRRLLLDPAGGLADTGESLSLPSALNVYCARGSASGLVVSSSGAALRSFTVPGLDVVDTRLASGNGRSAVISPGGMSAYVRDLYQVSAFGFDPATGRLAEAAAFQFAVPSSNSFFGMEQMAIDPAGAKLYVPGPAALQVHDAADGTLLATLTHPDLVAPTGVCLPADPDQDDDGLADPQEESAGSDPQNPDTDGDGLRDGFEVQHGFAPLVAGDESQDPDGDGLDNLAEQAAGTDPWNADTDGDGLSDGEEALVHGTDPREPDSDRDGLRDGTEVGGSGTDPRIADSDGGGVRDGDEANRDGTDPLDPSDDRPAGLGMVMDDTRRKAVVFDRDTDAVIASIPLPAGAITTGDCLILDDGSTGFATDFASRVHVFDLAASPPEPAPPPNPIPISNPGEDLARSADGGFLVICDGSGVAPISVVDLAARTELDTVSFGFDCNSVDTCPDGSVLVTSFNEGLVRRLELDAAGNLTDTGDSLSLTQPVNVYCAPDGRSGLVVSRTQSQGLTTFRLPDLQPVDTRALPEAPFAAALSPSGDAVYVRFTRADEGGVWAFHYDPQTAHLDLDPFLSFPVATTTRFFGMEQMALDSTGTRLYVSEAATLTVFEATTGEPLSGVFHPDIVAPTGVCLAQADQDGDGLSDDLERALGTDPGSADTDGDGLSDAFEARNGLDPLSAGDGAQDPDADGLDNAAEEVARTDPRNADTDADGLTDGEELLLYGTDPRRRDGDGDRLLDGDEVRTHGTDPNLPDTDGGGVRDGNEIEFDHTDPLDPADDRPSGLGIVNTVFNATHAALVFDAETDEVVTTLSLPPLNQPMVSCAISGNGRTGFLTNLSSQVWFVDMAGAPPQLTPAPNPIPISNLGERIAPSADGRFLVVCGRISSGLPGPISVVDVEARTEISTMPFAGGCDELDVCPDGTVVAVSRTSGILGRYDQDPAGNLIDRGDVREVLSPVAVRCARDARSAIVVTGSEVASFALPGLEPLDRRTLPGAGTAMDLSPSGASVFVRHSPGGARVDVYGYEASTGYLSPGPLRSFPVAGNEGRILLDRSGARLYVPQYGVRLLRTYDTSTGARIGGVLGPDANLGSVACFRRYDLDSDGLLDDEEEAAASDPANSDTDGDGLLDGFEARNGLDPLSPADGSADPDLDGLDNPGEQAARTDPWDPDSDDDGLADGEEVLVYGTDPRHRDTDRDDLDDGFEVSSSGTDPRDPDSDAGGVQDGTEVGVDETDPLDPADDRPSGPGMVVTTQGTTFVFDPESLAFTGSVPLGFGGPGDCVVTPDGRVGFITSGSQERILAVNLAASPPVLFPPPNPGSSLPVEDIAISPDGRFLVACNAMAYGGQTPQVTVLNAATRTQVATFPLGESCASLDVCEDGSVLVSSSGVSPGIRRLLLDATGHLADTGESLAMSAAGNVSCGPGGAVGVVVAAPAQTIQSFRIPGLQAVDSRALPGIGVSTSWLPVGADATLFVRRAYSDVQAYHVDLRTAALSPDPLFGFHVGSVSVFPVGLDQMVVDRTGDEVLVPQLFSLRAYRSSDGALRRARFRPDMINTAGVCLPAPADRDADGLPDSEERRLGTDPTHPDTDGDGLRDGFEARHGLDPLMTDDPQDDADGDGLSDGAEQTAGTDPFEPDTDGDGLGDGDELLVWDTDPRRSDSDADAVPDGQDNCPLQVNPGQEDVIHPNGVGDVCDDPDGDGTVDAQDNCPDLANTDQGDTDGDGVGDVCDVCLLDPLNDADGDGSCAQADNCPAIFNPQQGDGDGDGTGDPCDICPDIPNPTQAEQAACIDVREDGGTCLEAEIVLLGPDVSGAVIFGGSEVGPPDSLRFEALLAQCGAGDTLRFELNGVLVGTLVDDPSIPCDCQGAVQSLTFSDASTLTSLWQVGGDNRFVVRKGGPYWAFAWARVIAQRGAASQSTCLLDINGGDCTEADLCAAGFSASFPDTEVVVQVDCEGGCINAPFTASSLPGSLAISDVSDGPQLLCVTVDRPGAYSAQDCRAVTKQGERFLTINGAACGDPPRAEIQGGGGQTECTSPAGGTIQLDGSLSSDPDSTPGTHDDIALFEWFEDFGLSTKTVLGTGELLPVVLPLGAHTITLRVTDRSGLSGTAAGSFEVVDTVAPTISVSLSPAILWPPFHGMIPVQATVLATDACGAPDVLLVSVTSNEPDDAPGGGDGKTVDDVQGAATGADDRLFELRAERAAQGAGRIYTVLYRAQDPAGNTAEATALAHVPHDQGWSQEPVGLNVRRSPAGTILEWQAVPGALQYSAIRGDLDQVHDVGPVIDVGPVVCILGGTTDTSTVASPDRDDPPAGQAFFYLLEFTDGVSSSFGSDLAPKSRVSTSGGCP